MTKTLIASPFLFDEMTLEEAWELVGDPDPDNCWCNLYDCFCRRRTGECCKEEFRHAEDMLAVAARLAWGMKYVINRNTVVTTLKKANQMSLVSFYTCTICGNPPPCSHVIIGKKTVTVDREEWNNIQAELIALRRYKDAKEMEEMRRQPTERVTWLQPSTVMFNEYPYTDTRTFKIQPNM